MNSEIMFKTEQLPEKIYSAIDEGLKEVGFSQDQFGAGSSIYIIPSSNSADKFDMSEEAKKLFIEVVQNISNNLQTKIIIEDLIIMSGDNQFREMIPGKEIDPDVLRPFGNVIITPQS